MNNRDFDQSDGRVLAEFAGFERFDKKDSGLVLFHPKYGDCWWKPWSLEPPMWQIQSLLDAVRENDVVNEFRDNLIDEIDANEPGLGIMDGVETPPGALCSAILEMEGE